MSFVVLLLGLEDYSTPCESDLPVINVEHIWTSDSPVENLNAVIAKFYAVMCKDEVLPFEVITKMDDKKHFAYICKCGKRHAAHGSVWSIVASTVTKNTPSENHPEYEEYRRRRKEFLNEVKHIDVRDFAEPFLRASPEGAVIDLALKSHQKIVERFISVICNSKVTEKGEATVAHFAEYDCSLHQTKHYITPQQNSHYRSLINGGKVPPEFIENLSKLSQRIVLRDTSAVFREFQEAFPSRKIESVVFQEQLMEKRKIKAKRTEVQKQQEEAKRLQKALHGKKKLSAEKQSKPKTAVYDDPNLYILKPSLVSDEWFVEYHICGRKVAYETVSTALIYKHTHFQEGYDVYECPYCSRWHYGRKAAKTTFARQVKSGKRWYSTNYKKANAFIHKIMLEEF